MQLRLVLLLGTLACVACSSGSAGDLTSAGDQTPGPSSAPPPYSNLDPPPHSYPDLPPGPNSGPGSSSDGDGDDYGPPFLRPPAAPSPPPTPWSPPFYPIPPNGDDGSAVSPSFPAPLEFNGELRTCKSLLTNEFGVQQDASGHLVYERNDRYGSGSQMRPEIPASWVCATTHYNSSDGCDCNCGAADPDCEDSKILCNCFYTEETRCSAKGFCYSPDYGKRNKPHLSPKWTCDPAFFNTDDGCDCGCGDYDPDCETAFHAYMGPVINPARFTLYGCPNEHFFCNKTGECEKYPPGQVSKGPVVPYILGQNINDSTAASDQPAFFPPPSNLVPDLPDIPPAPPIPPGPPPWKTLDGYYDEHGKKIGSHHGSGHDKEAKVLIVSIACGAVVVALIGAALVRRRLVHHGSDRSSSSALSGKGGDIEMDFHYALDDGTDYHPLASQGDLKGGVRRAGIKIGAGHLLEAESYDENLKARSGGKRGDEDEEAASAKSSDRSDSGSSRSSSIIRGASTPDAPGSEIASGVEPMPRAGLPGGAGQFECVEIPADELKLFKLIGRGAFGEVYKGKWKSAVVVAVKRVPLLNLDQSSRLHFSDSCIREAQVLVNLNHPHVISFYGVSREPSSLSFVMEFMPRGSLDDLLREEGSNLTRLQRLKICVEIASGVQYLHQNKIIHRDLKTANIFLSEQLSAKVGDFGLAFSVATLNSAAQTVVGTPGFMAPEVVNGKRYRTCADVWSFGAILCEVMSGKKPYGQYEFGLQILAAMLIRREIPQLSPIQDAIDEELASIVQRCCSFEESQRPSSKDLLSQLNGLYCRLACPT